MIQAKLYTGSQANTEKFLSKWGNNAKCSFPLDMLLLTFDPRISGNTQRASICCLLLCSLTAWSGTAEITRHASTTVSRSLIYVLLFCGSVFFFGSFTVVPVLCSYITCAVVMKSCNHTQCAFAENQRSWLLIQFNMLYIHTH